MKYQIQVRRLGYIQKKYPNLRPGFRTWGIVSGFNKGWEIFLKQKFDEKYGLGPKEVLIVKFGKGVKGYRKAWHGYFN